ncbi:MAG: hypothetical protein QOI96_415, partial [Verrucomicrobiota bacterium]
DFQLKSDSAKKLRIRDHWDRVGMTADLAVEPAFYLSDVRDVIEVSVRKEQEFQIDIA